MPGSIRDPHPTELNKLSYDPAVSQINKRPQLACYGRTGGAHHPRVAADLVSGTVGEKHTQFAQLRSYALRVDHVVVAVPSDHANLLVCRS